MNPHLFVYGTLMPGSRAGYGQAMRARLAREARRLGPASTSGRLYDLGSYPGLVERPDTEEIVHGELLALSEPEPTFAWLDRYEGIVAGAGPGEYARIERPVGRQGAPAPISAWVYVYRWEVARARHVPSGRWLAGA